MDRQLCHLQTAVDRAEGRAIARYRADMPLTMYRTFHVIVEGARKAAEARARLDAVLRHAH